MQKVILILAAMLCFTNIIHAQVATSATETAIAQPTKRDTLIVSNPNTIILYQGASVPVVYAQPSASQLVPMEAQRTKSKKSSNRTEKMVLSTLAGGFTGMVLGGAIAYNSAMNGNFADALFAPFTTIAGAATGTLIGTGAGLCLSFALTSK